MSARGATDDGLQEEDALLAAVKRRKQKERAREFVQFEVEEDVEMEIEGPMHARMSGTERTISTVNEYSTANPMDLLYAQKCITMLNFEETLSRLKGVKGASELQTLLVVDKYCTMIRDRRYTQGILERVRNPEESLDQIAKEIALSFAKYEVSQQERDDMLYVTIVEKTLKRLDSDIARAEREVREERSTEKFEKMRELEGVVESCERILKYSTPNAIYEGLQKRMSWYRAKIFAVEAGSSLEGRPPENPFVG